MHIRETKLERKEKNPFFPFLSSLSIRHAQDLLLYRGLLHRGVLHICCNSGKAVLACHMHYALLHHMGTHFCRKPFEKRAVNFTPKGVLPYLSAEDKPTWPVLPHLFSKLHQKLKNVSRGAFVNSDYSSLAILDEI